MKDLYERLKDRNMKSIEIPKWGPYLRKKWEAAFVSHLSDEDKESIFLHDDGSFCGYLWHVFSYEKKECLEREKAQDAFRQQPKKGCYVFYQHSDYALLLENASRLSVDDLMDEQDVYVVDKKFNWTYVQTHETGYCGPYFCHRTN
ncbi:DUF4275 family protein [Rossellomorea sp. NPDC077527]|uniref:DUF4275 family protein n=1 Tax=Rossellomorea sp. NPDC077527 TaxID=3364510 RepID=UPI0037C66E66